MKIKSGNELDWEMALKAAQDLVKQCEAAFYAPPEAVSSHFVHVNRVCVAMDAIVDALKLQHGSGNPPTRVESP
jgi:hypothetical protein